MVSLTIFPNAGFAYIASHAIFGIIATRTPHFAILYFFYIFETSKHTRTSSITPRAAGRVPREASGAAAKEKPTWRRVLPKPPTALHTHAQTQTKTEHTQNKHTH